MPPLNDIAPASHPDTPPNYRALRAGHARGRDEVSRHVALMVSQEKNAAAQAAGVMQDVQKEWPELPGALYAQGILAMRFAHYEEAEAAARAALQLDETSQDARLLLPGPQGQPGLLKQADQPVHEPIQTGQKQPVPALGAGHAPAD